MLATDQRTSHSASDFRRNLRNKRAAVPQSAIAPTPGSGTARVKLNPLEPRSISSPPARKEKPSRPLVERVENAIDQAESGSLVGRRIGSRSTTPSVCPAVQFHV